MNIILNKYSYKLCVLEKMNCMPTFFYFVPPKLTVTRCAHRIDNIHCGHCAAGGQAASCWIN